MEPDYPAPLDPGELGFEAILYEKAPPRATITLNRPDVLNAFNRSLHASLADALREAAEPDVRAVVITGAGRGFCVGQDLNEFRAGASEVGERLRSSYNRSALALQRLEKPVIAAVNGLAIGGGHVLHVLCDVSIAAEHARFGQAGPRVGSFDAGFGTAYLARVVGEKKAREIWFWCRQYDAAEALRMNLVNKVVPAADLLGEAKAWAAEVAVLSPTALRFLKQSFNADTEHLAGVGQLAFTGLGLFVQSDEAREGVEAFTAKRPPDFAPYRSAV